MNHARILLSTIFLLLIVARAESDVIYNIQLSPKPVAALQFNQNVNITFDYRTSQTGGVRIFARPMTAGALSANYAAHASPIYPLGSGSGSGSFTITSGDLTVDAIRLQVYNPAQTVLLLEFYVPVKYVYSAHALFNIAMTPASPSSMQFNQDISVSFSYGTTQAGGVRIFPRPMTGSSLTPNYAASASPLYPTGSGTGTGSFTITTGNAKVDGVRFQMYNDAQTVLLLEIIIPVNYPYAAHSISNIQFTPSSPQGLQLNSDITITFDYRTSQSGGALIFPRPFTDGALSPGYGASASPTYATGSGTGGGTFTILSGDVTVDSVRFRMTTVDQTQTLLEYFVPVNFHYSAHKIANIQFSPSSPAYFTSNESDTSRFDYTTTQVGGVLMFARPFSGGILTPNYAASPSPTFAIGSGTGSGWFTISAGNVLVDHMRFQMLNTTQTQTLVEWFYPVHFQFGNMTSVGVGKDEPGIPPSYALEQNYPNPFNPSTTIRYGLSLTSEVTLTVFNTLGQQVALLQNGEQEAGYHEVRFDGSGLSSGVYFYRLRAGDFVQTRKLLLMK